MNARIVVPIVVLLLVAGGLVYLFTMGTSDALDQGLLVFGRGADSKSLDPAAIDDGESVKVVDNLYDTLAKIAFDPQQGRLVTRPHLAEKWEPLPDGKPGLKITLKPNLKFHDGTSCDAAAVVFSLKRLAGADSKSPYKSFYATILVDALAAPSALEVVVPTNVPDAQLLSNLSMFPASIVSPTAVAKHGTGFGTEAAVGTGAFKLKRWERNRRIELEPNPEYFAGAPTVKGLHFVEIADNNARVQALRNGDISVADGLNTQDYEGIQASPTLKLKLRDPGREISLLYLAFNTKVAPFDNLKFRQALAHAVDKDKIALLYNGVATRAELAVPPGILGADPAFKGFARDLEKAKALLAESGVTTRALKLALMTNPRPYILQPKEVARAIADAFKDLGLEVTLDEMPWATYLAHVKKGEHQMGLLGWSTDNGDADNFLSTFYDSSNTEVGTASNISFFQDKAMDALLERQRRSVVPDERRAALEETYRYANEQAPLVPIVYVKDSFAHHARVEGVELDPIGNLFMGFARIAKR